MHSTPNPKQIDSSDVIVPPTGEKHASEYGEMGREDLARALELFSQRYAADPQNTTSPPPAVNRGSRLSFGRPALRGFIGFILAACIVVAAFAWQSSYGDEAKQIVARWAPKLVPNSSLTPEKPVASAQPSARAAQVATAETALPEPVPRSQTASQDAATADGTQSPEVQLLQKMTRNLANLEQEIEQLKANQRQMARDNAQLKASQEQAARDNANWAEQLKAHQEQMASLAKTSGQNLRPKTSAPSSGRTKAR